MMTHFNRFPRRWSALLVVLVVASASAGVTPSVDTGSAVPGAVSSPINRAQLRCWQKGRLLFEEVGWQLSGTPKELGNNPLRFYPAGGGQKDALYLISMGESLCLYRAGD
jgi:hypothetical protein